MANLFNNKQAPVSREQVLANRYTAARMNLLLLICFSAINIVLLVIQNFTYFLFSASIPYIITDIAMLMCGKYPEEIYTGELEGMEFLDGSVLVVAVIISALILLAYLLCFFMSRKNKGGWLVVSLVMFIFDTIVMFLYYGISADAILDVIFHIAVIVYLSLGIHANGKIKKLQLDGVQSNEQQILIVGEGKENLSNSPVLRIADMDAKSRVLLETTAFGRKIIYRRVKRVNELIIDGNVYAEYTALIEVAHMLTANIDGHAVAVGYDGSFVYITIDGELALRKMRLI